jgi:hypothetical protein
MDRMVSFLLRPLVLVVEVVCAHSTIMKTMMSMMMSKKNHISKEVGLVLG